MTPGGPYGMPSSSPRPGDVIAGRYRIESELGHGGFGAVYRATHVQLGRVVALKMLLPEMLAHDEGLVRFRREAELAERLQHPNTVRLYDFGQTELGLPYIAFELLRGEPLDKAVWQGPMPLARATRITSQVLKALMEAHALGIIHRDIKPANIFLCEFSGERDFVKVLDFGIAKSTSSSTLLTKAGHSIGTPNYMSPEQVRGEPLTPASDLYAVGLMLAEMLTGRIVYGGNPSDVALAQLSQHPVPLSPELSHSPLFHVLTRATQKEAARRYQSAAEMLRDLDAVPLAPSLHPAPAVLPPSGYAPTALATVVRAPAAPSRASSVLPFVLVGFGAAVLLGAVGWFAFRDAPSGDKSHDVAVADDDDKPKKKKKKKPKSTDDDEPSDSKSIKQRLEKLGWKINAESTTKQPTLDVKTYTCQKGSQMAVVYVYETENEQTIKALETSLSSQKGSATRRKSKDLYWVLTIPNDASAAQQLLDDLDL